MSVVVGIGQLALFMAEASVQQIGAIVQYNNVPSQSFILFYNQT